MQASIGMYRTKNEINKLYSVCCGPVESAVTNPTKIATWISALVYSPLYTAPRPGTNPRKNAATGEWWLGFTAAGCVTSAARHGSQ